MSDTESELPQAALDMLVLQAVSAGPLHGFDITQRLDLITGDAFRMPRASIYPTLHRLEGAGLLAGAWQRLAAGRDAKFYQLSRLRNFWGLLLGAVLDSPGEPHLLRIADWVPAVEDWRHAERWK